MSTIKPFTFTCDTEPKAVYWKKDIFTYYKEQGVSDSVAHISFHEQWVKNPQVVVLDNGLVVEPLNTTASGSIEDMETNLKGMEDTIRILQGLRDSIEDDNTY
jgi:hypothetical protein